jgi:hypothetical protein
MMAERKYSNETVVALAAWSRGTCYYPGCSAPLVIKRRGHPVIAAQIAHVHALKRGGARFRAELTPAERDDWPNLIFLCQGDHTEVDRKHPELYPVNVLLEWKAKHERDGMAGLRGLSELTEERLETILEDSAAQLREDVNAALDQIKAINSDTAELVRALADQVADFGSANDPYADSAAVLSHAAELLRNLEDVAPILADAADKLANLEDSASALASAADSLSGLEDTAAMISQAASELQAARGDY